MNSRSESQRDVSRSVLRVFGPTLILTGLAGFIIPSKKAATSGAPAYNVFHLIFGTIGVACARSRHRWPVQVFNVGFGAVDLYQAVASRRAWFPQRWFRWKTADDALHVAIGAGLVAAGLSGRARPTAASSRKGLLASAIDRCACSSPLVDRWI
jgi:hypothetical protein